MKNRIIFSWFLHNWLISVFCSLLSVAETVECVTKVKLDQSDVEVQAKRSKNVDVVDSKSAHCPYGLTFE